MSYKMLFNVSLDLKSALMYFRHTFCLYCVLCVQRLHENVSVRCFDATHSPRTWNVVSTMFPIWMRFNRRSSVCLRNVSWICCIEWNGGRFIFCATLGADKKKFNVRFRWVAKVIRRFHRCHQWKAATQNANGPRIAPHCHRSFLDRNEKLVGISRCYAFFVLHRFIIYWPRPTRLQLDRIWNRECVFHCTACLVPDAYTWTEHRAVI